VYFITICAHERRCLFGQVVGEVVQPSRLGQIVESEWIRSGEMHPAARWEA
jgi:hypothetical protein